jgi:hypothetical protein
MMKKIFITILISSGFFFAKSQTGSYSTLTVGSANAISIADGAIMPASLADAYHLEMHATKLNVGQKNNQSYNATQNTAMLNSAVTFDGAEIVRFRTLFNTSYFNMYSVSGGKIQSSFVQQGSPQLFLSGNSNNSIGVGTNTPNIYAKLDVSGNMFITNNGKLYIGALDGNTMTQIANYSLAVNGNAIFTKAKVALYGSWPDYVFAPTYKLTPLDSLEKFIQLNKHLPEVPAASEVEKDGIDLGDNQVLLLKKIEELTLIIIDQNKKQEILENEINEQAKQIESLDAKLTLLSGNEK